MNFTPPHSGDRIYEQLPHAHHFGHFPEAVDQKPESCVPYVSGIGRNACYLSLVALDVRHRDLLALCYLDCLLHAVSFLHYDAKISICRCLWQQNNRRVFAHFSPINQKKEPPVIQVTPFPFGLSLNKAHAYAVTDISSFSFALS